tara:strand:- start:3082 stop:5706 length:2625 start_codon:yes stop_codon:yes gene_type:complete
MAQQPRQQRIGIYGKFTAPALDTSESDKMRALAGLGQTAGKIAMDVARPAAAAKGAKEGALAAEQAVKINESTGEKTYSDVETKTFGLSAGAFNQAAQARTEELSRNAVADYTAQINNQSREILSKFAEVHKDDPVAYQDAANNYLSGTVSAIKNTELAARVQAGLGARIFSDGNALQKAYDVKTLNTQITNVTKEASDAFDEAERLIVNGDAIGARAELDTSIMALQEVARMNPDFDVETAVADLERNYDGLQLKASVSNTADNGDFAAANQIIIDATKEVPSNFTEAQWEQTTNKARSALVKQKSLFDSVQATATAENKAFVSNSLTLIESGQPLSPENMVKLNNLAAGNPLAEKAITTATNTSVFIAMPDSQQLELIDAIDPSDPDTLDQYKSYLMARNNVQKALRADSWGTAIQQNTITEEELADFAEFDVTALLTQDLTALQKAEYQQAYQRNEEIAARLTEHYGYKFAPFNNQQVQALSDAIPNMSATQKVELADSVGPNSNVWGLLVDKPGAGLFSMAATIENSDTQRAIFLGEQKLATAPFRKMSEESDMMDAAFYEVMGDTLNTENAGLAYKTALAHYASTFEGEAYQYNPSDFQDSIRAITGNVKTVRGKKTIPPSYPKGNNDGTVVNLEGFFDDMTVETFEELGGKLEPYTETRAVGVGAVGARGFIEVEGDRNLDKVKGNYRIKAVDGKNNYSLLGPNGTIMTGANGSPLIINVNQERMSDYLGTKYRQETQSLANRMMQNLMPASAQQGGNVPTKRTPVYQSDMDQGMTRPDGSIKSEVGYLGPVVRDDGGIMTEFSIGVQIDGVETLVPSIIPTLTKAEVEVLRTLPEGENPPEAIQAKAADYARRRIAAGLNPFYQDGE